MAPPSHSPGGLETSEEGCHSVLLLPAYWRESRSLSWAGSRGCSPAALFNIPCNECPSDPWNSRKKILLLSEPSRAGYKLFFELVSFWLVNHLHIWASHIFLCPKQTSFVSLLPLQGLDQACLDEAEILNSLLRVVCVLVLSHVWLCATPWTCSLPGSSVHGLLWARILEWVAMPSIQGTLLTQGSNPWLLLWQESSLPLEPPGKPILGPS